MKRFFMILVLLGCLSSELWAESIIYLKNSVEVSSADVLLQDLVEDPHMLPAEWRTRRVLAAPPAGEVSYHALTAVAYGLGRYNDMRKVTLQGEPVVSITRRDRRLEKEEFRDPLLSYLKRTPPWKENELDITVMNIPRNLRVPAGEVSYRITHVDQKTSKGYSMAYVTVSVGGSEVMEVPVGVDIRYLTEVWVVARKLERGHILGEDDLRSEMRVVEATDNYVASVDDLFGHEVNRPQSPGDLLKRNYVSKPLCAKRGDWVAINAVSSNLHITLRGKAMANGRLGDRIMCVNERSHRQVLVELKGSGTGILVRL